MSTLRLTGDLRREQILDAARRCFARYGYAGTTTKSVAAAASISEGLLFKHFPTKAALYAEILVEACEADPEMHRLLELEPSTSTLVILIRDMVAHFLRAPELPDQEEAERIRLMVSSHLGDGEFARLLFEKIGNLVEPVFTASLESAIASGDARRVEGEPLNLFWLAHQVAHMIALTKLPAVPSLPYPETEIFQMQVCQFVLRGIGLTDRAIATYLNAEPSQKMAAPRIAEGV
ncbi:MAG: TetR/AcrR family transcriptional regulator [Rhizobiales bacterium]|nr:TetR/AcrR family transcriptional regulator [Hyphomicrobiales bacterium]